MANTRDTLGDQVTLDSLVSGSLTSFEENGMATVRRMAFAFSHLKRVKMGNLSEISEYMFYNSELEKVDADDFPLVDVIKSSAFYESKQLASVIFQNAKTVQEHAFWSCSKLETALFPAIVSSGNQLFYNCSKLKHLLVGAKNVPTYLSVGESLIRAIMGAVYVPAESIRSYRTRFEHCVVTALENYPLTRFETISDTWAEIASNSNYATDYKIGDIKCVEYNDKLYPMELIAFDTDEKTDGTTAKMTWLLYNAIETYAFDSANTGHNWEDSALRAHLADDILPNLDVSPYVVPVKKTFYDSAEQATKTCTDSIWIPSCREMNDGSYENSGCIYSTRFPYTNSRLYRYKGVYPVAYPLRTERLENPAQHMIVPNNNGSYSTSLKTSRMSVMFGFCI